MVVKKRIHLAHSAKVFLLALALQVPCATFADMRESKNGNEIESEIALENKGGTKSFEIWHSVREHHSTFEEIAKQFNASYAHSKIEFKYIHFSEIDDHFLNTEKSLKPNGLLVPSDRVSKQEFSLMEIPYDWIQKDLTAKNRKTVTFKNKLLGIPIFAGNHLIMLYNRNHVGRPATTWQSILRYHKTKSKNKVETVGWNYYEPYWVVSFFPAFNAWPIKKGELNFDNPRSAKALDWYKGLSASGLIDSKCDHICTRKKFLEGKLAYALLHEFDLYEANKVLGDQLGVTVMPSIDGASTYSMGSSIALLFPENIDEQAIQTAKDFSIYMQSLDVQKQLLLSTYLIVSNPNVYRDRSIKNNQVLKYSYLQSIKTKSMNPNEPLWPLWDSMSKWVQPFIDSDMTPVEVISKLQSEIKEN